MLQKTLVCVYLFELVFLFSLDKYPEAKLLDHKAVPFLICWGNSKWFSGRATWIYSPTNSTWRFPFLLILINVCYFLSFWWFLWVWGDMSLWFWSSFPWWLVILNIFSSVCWPFVYSGPLPILKSGFSVVFFFKLSCMSSLYILDINPWSGTLVVSESQFPLTPEKLTIPYLTTLDFVTQAALTVGSSRL